jgi:hypothetical protein
MEVLWGGRKIQGAGPNIWPCPLCLYLAKISDMGVYSRSNAWATAS